MKKFKKSNRTFFLLAVMYSLWGGATDLNGQPINSKFPSEPLSTRIEKLKHLALVDLAYDTQLVTHLQSQPLKANGQDFEVALAASLKQTGYTFSKSGKNSYLIVREVMRQERGGISGKVLDAKGLPIIGAFVVIKGTTTGEMTDDYGDFTLRELSPGSYTLVVSSISFKTLEVQDVQVATAQLTPLNLVLQEDLSQLGELVITTSYKRASAEGLYNRQKNMVSLSDGVSADLIRKTSDNNAAQVLKRVSGVVMEGDGKFVNIRGLGDRYNSVQLNGSALPSTEANVKNFSFEMIPSVLIDNIVINKTFTPDLSAEFVGGLVNVTSLAVPKEAFFEFALGTGMNTQSYGGDFWSREQSSADWFFGNINDRTWYQTKFDIEQYSIWHKEHVNSETSIDRKRELEKSIFEMSAQVPNTFGLKRYKANPTSNYSLSFGKPFQLAEGHVLGVVVAATYRHEERIQELVEAQYRKVGNRSYGGNTYDFTNLIGAMANLGWETADHKIVFSNLYNNRLAIESSRVLVQVSSDRIKLEQHGAVLRNSLHQSKLEGEHNLLNQALKLTWMGDFNKVKRQSPDERLIDVEIVSQKNEHPDNPSQDTNNLFTPVLAGDGRYITYGSTWGMIRSGSSFDSGNIRHTDYEEDKKNIAVNIECPVLFQGQKQLFKAGYYATFRSGNYDQLYLRPQNSELFNSVDCLPIITGEDASVNEFFDPKYFREGRITYNPYFGKSAVSGDAVRDFYQGSQKLHAAFVLADLTFFENLHVSGGVRIENSNMEVLGPNNSFKVQNLQSNRDTLYTTKTTKLFPSITLIYNIRPEFNLRAAFAKTIARPDFNEMTGISYYDVYLKSPIYGQKLEDTDIKNYDLRLEWYPNPGEVLSLGYFYKDFTAPVEMLARTLGAGNFDFSKINALAALVQGMELNVRKSMGFISQDSFLKNLFISGNATVLKGKIDYDLERMKKENVGYINKDPETLRRRPLQGLAPVIYNASLSYEGTDFGIATNYGHVGTRVVATGSELREDEYERARNILDFQFSAKFLRKQLELKISASDILNEPLLKYVNSSYYLEQESNLDIVADLSYNKGIDKVTSHYKKGVNYALSLTYKF